MRRYKLSVLVAGVGLALWALPVTAEDTSGHMHGDHGKAAMKTEQVASRITGEVVDVLCYLRMDAKGPGHVQCAQYCANLGIPLGILEAGTGKIYLIFPEGHGNPLEKAAPLIGKQVEAVGKIHMKGGLHAMTVEKIAEVKG